MKCTEYNLSFYMKILKFVNFLCISAIVDVMWAINGSRAGVPNRFWAMPHLAIFKILMPPLLIFKCCFRKFYVYSSKGSLKAINLVVFFSGHFKAYITLMENIVCIKHILCNVLRFCNTIVYLFLLFKCGWMWRHLRDYHEMNVTSLRHLCSFFQKLGSKYSQPKGARPAHDPPKHCRAPPGGLAPHGGNHGFRASISLLPHLQI
jgi:hypothetical protein